MRLHACALVHLLARSRGNRIWLLIFGFATVVVVPFLLATSNKRRSLLPLMLPLTLPLPASHTPCFCCCCYCRHNCCCAFVVVVVISVLLLLFAILLHFLQYREVIVTVCRTFLLQLQFLPFVRLFVVYFVFWFYLLFDDVFSPSSPFRLAYC